MHGYAAGAAAGPLQAAAARAISFARQARRRAVDELAEFVRFASVSVQPAQAGEVARCAGWLAARLGAIGLEHVRVTRTPGHPVVTADWLHAPGAPTLLVYGHYDVQPADPLAEWTSPPFVPTIRGPHLYGRGASDDKGQLFVHVKAIESWLHGAGTLPVNVRCLFDGEEEIGSPSLPGFLRRHGEYARAEVAVLSDTWMPAPDRPAIIESLRGALSVEVKVVGQAHDLHSGNYGGALYNPLQALSELIAGLHDARGRITIPGFYDRVRALTPWERAEMARCGPSDAWILGEAGAARGWGEAGFSLYERTTVRPALSINGIVGGYQGPGVKAVLPACALAKLSFRLVPDQDPAEIERLLYSHLRRTVPRGLRVGVRAHMRVHPVVIAREQPALAAASAAYHAAFGVPPVFLRLGGTVPVVHLLQTRCGVSTVLMGFALPDDAIHAPDERFYLPNYFRGIETSIRFLAELAQLGGAGHAAARR
jgi:acetylornithine deacetylase/succinyl-diaminopimelate desuccinylase-like protein